MGWKIYFWILLILLLIAYSAILMAMPSVWDFIDPIFSLIALAGVFAYGYKKKLFSANFWRIWLLVIISWDLTYNILLTDYLGVAQQLRSITEEETFYEELFSWVLIIPEYIALYLLGFKSVALWRQ